MQTNAVVLHDPGKLSIESLVLDDPTAADAVVAVRWSGISTGTERLLWTGRMPPFPGMGYPLVPGYESVGEIVEAGADSGVRVGQTVFVPGARCFGPVRGLFGGAASHLVSAGGRLVPIDDALGERGTLIALAATARHALAGIDLQRPLLIVGHGVLGRLVARIAGALGGSPKVWETNPVRRSSGDAYLVVAPDGDARRDYATILDVSGDRAILDTAIARLAQGGEIVLAGFYEGRLEFDFAPAFLREARIRVAAQWRPEDLTATLALIAADRLSLDGLVTHRRPAADAPHAYRTAFGEPECLKMILDWRAA
ncbi:2-desacetyl-2-hydroxyethyl bacteriochlorophyllide A dehydrogenase [Methylobacterium sp. Leaf104]|uniref:chlorophyll synthesis pathway protein BchC n=1 Tax=Methylobacterium TaxID=407 RepID=UPI0006FF0873|nr:MULTISPECIES: chlorophyll synthesis pathway protein BchC [Methylobacterium]KQP42905.1 2-desacetyl-2-hydroxyethyl bacteriochlorophyllide A dehydrogenase [Methylobacterium sp. Leaf104]MCI9878485.1 chlorophyll synthesis pathway protein BchC [Methylobacterium goesingense]